MSSIYRKMACLCSFFSFAVIAVSCQSTQITSSDSGGTRPPDTVENVKEARFHEAIQGLSFDTGLVVVEPNRRRSNTKLGKEFYEQGLEAFSVNRVIDSLTLFNKAVHAAPDLAVAYNSLGKALLAEGEADYASASYRTALALDENLIEAKYNIALHLGMTGNRVEAIELMNEVLETDTENTIGHERIAVWSYYLGDYQTSWQHTNAAEALGHKMPPQFIALLEKQSPK
ncbi:MAG: hypothetical protein IH984_09860 [Planctomycetes bacterium]|nr:hypothetical protein [Planctomycetota bacterium]